MYLVRQRGDLFQVFSDRYASILLPGTRPSTAHCPEHVEAVSFTCFLSSSTWELNKHDSMSNQSQCYLCRYSGIVVINRGLSFHTKFKVRD